MNRAYFTTIRHNECQILLIIIMINFIEFQFALFVL